MNKPLQFRIIIEQDENGIFVASVPTLPGCHTEGNTLEEALNNIQDAIKLNLEARREISYITDDSQTQFIGVREVTVDYGTSAHS